MAEKESIILIPRTPGDSRYTAEAIAVAFSSFVGENGGCARAEWLRDTLTIYIQRFPRRQVTRAVKNLCTAIAQQKLPLTIVDLPGNHPFPGSRRGIQLQETVVYLRLSQWLLNALPDGTYVSSSDRTGGSRFRARLGKEREMLWKRAVMPAFWSPRNWASGSNRRRGRSWKGSDGRRRCRQRRPAGPHASRGFSAAPQVQP